MLIWIWTYRIEKVTKNTCRTHTSAKVQHLSILLMSVMIEKSFYIFLTPDGNTNYHQNLDTPFL